MIFWYFCALIWFKNIEKMLLQMTSGFLQLESTLEIFIFCQHNSTGVLMSQQFFVQNKTATLFFSIFVLKICTWA
jgi:hypothetical protein